MEELHNPYKLLILGLLVIGVVLTGLAFQTDDVYLGWVAGASTVGGAVGICRR